MRNFSHNEQRDPEAGYILLTVIFMTTVLLISLAIAVPKITMSIQRDKDLETIHRGEQYRRALQLYYRQFNTYPTSIDQLVSSNNMRFLRKKYVDPETGKDDWKPVFYGQAHVRPLGFFGQPLSAVGGLMASAAVPGMAGGMAGGMYAPTAGMTTDANGVPVSDNGTGANSGASSAFGNNGSSNSGFGSNNGSAFGNNGSSGSTLGNSGTFSMGGQPSSGGLGSNSGFGAGQSTTGQTGIGPGGSTSTGFGSTSSGTSATTFGGSGGPIVGFTLPVKKPSLIDYMQQTSYDKWEFNYDPMVDQLQAAGSLFGGGGSNVGAGGSVPTGGLNGTQGGIGGAGGIGGTNPTGGTGTGTGGTGTTGIGPQGTDPNNPTTPNSPQ